MSLIVYLPILDRSVKLLRQMVWDLFLGEAVEIFYNFKRLDFRLRHPNGKEDMALLYLSTHQVLHDIIMNHQLFSSLRTILIVPDEEKETLAKAHLLRPRYLCCYDQDLTTLLSVLKKMKKSTPID